MGVVAPSAADQFAFQLPEQGIVGIDEFEVELDTAPNSGSGKSSAGLDPVLQDMEVSRAGQVVLAGRDLDVPEEFGSFAHQVGAPTQQIPSSPHGGGIDIGLRQIAPPQQSGDLISVDAIVLRLAAVDGFHVERVSEDKGYFFLLCRLYVSRHPAAGKTT